jgi:Ca-activated chloride channel family protein
MLVTVDGRTYPLMSAALVARAAGGLALTTLTQEFRNPFEEPLEVLYTLPLPADGAVLGYEIRIGERVIRGEIEKREKAKAAFEQALLEGRAAALLEQQRDDTFLQRLGSIPPGERVHVEVEVIHPLGFVPTDGQTPGQWEYRFPTVVGVRYEGEPGRVPDAGALDVDRAGQGEIPARIELDLTISDGLPNAIDADSPTHDIDKVDHGGSTRVSFRHGARLDRDVVVRWRACAASVGARVVEGPGRPGDEGRYALITLTPPRVPEAVRSRDVTVLLDASGSMNGAPLECAKHVVGELLRSLEPTDRFEVLAFAMQVRRLTGGMREARPADIRKALEQLARLEAGGGTEMASAVNEALAPLRQVSQRQVVLVTDGYIGFEPQVIGEIARRLPANARVHTVGVGAAPNRSLTRGVARAGRGVEVFAADDSSAAAAARRLCRATAGPVLTEVDVRGDAVVGVAPAKPRDVMAGQPLVIALEVRREGGAVEVSAHQAGSRDLWIWRIALPAALVAEPNHAEDNDGAPQRTSLPLGALYGREVIADLELRVAARDGQIDVLDRKIEAAGMRHRIASRMTSLVAIAEEPSVDPTLARRRQRIPVELPAGVSAEGTGLLGGPTLGRAQFMGAIDMASLEGSMPTASLTRALVSLPRAPRGMAPEFELVEVGISGGRVIQVTRDTVTIEFETPFQGFLLPDGEVNLWLDGKTWRVVSVVTDQSTPPGPHAAGLVVRLTLRLDGHPEWAQAARLEVRWLAQESGSSGKRLGRQFVLNVTNAAPTSSPR